METPDYETIARTYERICAQGMEPNIAILRSIRKTKAVRRKIGRMIKRGVVVKQQAVWPLFMKGKSGAAIA